MGRNEMHVGPGHYPAMKATDRGTNKDREAISRAYSKIWICKTMGISLVLSLDHSKVSQASSGWADHSSVCLLQDNLMMTQLTMASESEGRNQSHTIFLRYRIFLVLTIIT